MSLNKGTLKLSGPFPVLPTPFDAYQKLDLPGLEAILDRLLDRGIEGVTLLGSSSEAPYLTGVEKRRILKAALKKIAGRAAGLVGIIAWGTVQAVEAAREARDLGADALMVALPQYYRTPLGSVIEHYQAVVQATELPVIYYHYPETTGLDLSPRQMTKLFAEVELAGIKESGFSTPELASHLRRIHRPIQVFTGQSFNFLAALTAGAAGAICPMGVLMPLTSLSLMRAFEGCNKAGAVKMQRALDEALPIVIPGNVPTNLARRAFKSSLKTGLPLPKPPGVPHAGIKEALAALGIIGSAQVRTPQPALTFKKKREIKMVAEKLSEL